jgi:type IV secretory pathway TraG/TraD family ATPase VirD4
MILLVAFLSTGKYVLPTSEQLFKGLQSIAILSGTLCISLAAIPLILYAHSNELLFNVGTSLLTGFVNLFSTSEILFLMGIGICYRKKQPETFSIFLRKQSKIHAVVTALLSVLLILPAFVELHKLQATPSHVFYYFKVHAKECIRLLLPLFILLLLFYQLKKSLASTAGIKRGTLGEFGSSSFASRKELAQKGLYENADATYILSGQDDKGRSIFLPLKNKLTLSPQGGGETTCSSINVLLSHPGNTFVFDIKGELWATTARYRQKTWGKEIVVIDPYGITQTKDFAKGKPKALLKSYCFNPFDWIPSDARLRDRMINAFAASLIIHEGGIHQHFDDNAKILIRGLIDYIIQVIPKEARHLGTLYELLSSPPSQAQETFNHMARLTGKAKAAANQINRVGPDEKGSILSTSYRQIDWITDSNVSASLSHSNFDLKQFITGHMDIYVVLPEDQVKGHQRFVRMLLSLIISLIVQTDPSKLPQQKMLFLLDELAQLGYLPDVEQAIEVLRARRLVVWSVFQTLSQIKLYKKPDLFLGAFIKQIFTNDDVETMKWIQTLGGKKTILTRTVSSHEGDTKQKMQLMGGSSSKGAGESIQETGVDLIHLNQIRELKDDEQFIFMQGMKPIYCKKVRYFEHPFFKGKFDDNPIEAAKGS